MIEGITHDDLAQFIRCIEIAIQTVEQVEKPFQVLMGVSCRTRAIGLEQTLALRGAQIRPIRLGHLLTLPSFQRQFSHHRFSEKSQEMEREATSPICLCRYRLVPSTGV